MKRVYAEEHVKGGKMKKEQEKRERERERERLCFVADEYLLRICEFVYDGSWMLLEEFLRGE